MKLLKAALASFAMLFSGLSIAAPIAAAQGTSIVVIDQAKIMRDSAGGKDIVSKVNAIEKTMQAELQPTADSLTTEGNALEAKTANMTMDAMRADAALRAEVEAYAKKAQDFNRQRQVAAAELQATERKAWGDFFTALQPVLQEVVTEEGADLMLDRADVVYSGPSIDVTNSVITKMNAKMPTVSVVRQKMPAQQQQ
ncbi:OmpH family outer membrane protein [Henriciella litoralis]|uniref:OmpH family outer membrane protein n=1 Tax=Henriciella litoralis TaxID=568102 RepID=UPI0009FE4AE7|nr:OmpH family outer membrane protein [Henriciella litoralis]